MNGKELYLKINKEIIDTKIEKLEAFFFIFIFIMFMSHFIIFHFSIFANPFSLFVDSMEFPTLNVFIVDVSILTFATILFLIRNKIFAFLRFFLNNKKLTNKEKKVLVKRYGCDFIVNNKNVRVKDFLHFK